MKLSIIIPVFNEERTIGTLLERVRALQLDKEIIVVDDGSVDGTGKVLDAYEGLADVRIYRSPINCGKGAAVRIGLSLASGELITIQDADLELDPTDFHQLIAPILRNETSVVYGSRFLRQPRKNSLPLYWANRLLSGLTNVLYRSHLTDVETCYKVFRREVVLSLELSAVGFEIDPELTAQTLKRGYQIVELPISYAPRTFAQGKKISWRDGIVAVGTLLQQRFFDRSARRASR